MPLDYPAAVEVRAVSGRRRARISAGADAGGGEPGPAQMWPGSGVVPLTLNSVASSGGLSCESRSCRRCARSALVCRTVRFAIAVQLLAVASVALKRGGFIGGSRCAAAAAAAALSSVRVVRAYVDVRTHA